MDINAQQQQQQQETSSSAVAVGAAKEAAGQQQQQQQQQQQSLRPGSSSSRPAGCGPQAQLYWFRDKGLWTKLRPGVGGGPQEGFRAHLRGCWIVTVLYG
jgi:hypothetical protein